MYALYLRKSREEQTEQREETLARHAKYLRCTKQNCPIVLSYFDEVETEILNALKSELKDFEYYLENYIEEEKNKRELLEQELNLINKELSKKDMMINKAREMLELGVYTSEVYINRVNILENEKKSLYEARNALNDNNCDEEERTKKAIPILKNCLEYYHTLSIEDKNRLLKVIIKKIEYSKTIRNSRWHKNGNLSLKLYLKI